MLKWFIPHKLCTNSFNGFNIQLQCLIFETGKLRKQVQTHPLNTANMWLASTFKHPHHTQFAVWRLKNDGFFVAIHHVAKWLPRAFLIESRSRHISSQICIFTLFQSLPFGHDYWSTDPKCIIGESREHMCQDSGDATAQLFGNLLKSDHRKLPRFGTGKKAYVDGKWQSHASLLQIIVFVYTFALTFVQRGTCGNMLVWELFVVPLVFSMATENRLTSWSPNIVCWLSPTPPYCLLLL